MSNSHITDRSVAAGVSHLLRTNQVSRALGEPQRGDRRQPGTRLADAFCLSDTLDGADHDVVACLGDGQLRWGTTMEQWLAQRLTETPADMAAITKANMAVTGLPADEIAKHDLCLSSRLAERIQAAVPPEVIRDPQGAAGKALLREAEAVLAKPKQASRPPQPWQSEQAAPSRGQSR